MVVYLPYKEKVSGSNPLLSTKNVYVVQLVDASVSKTVQVWVRFPLYTPKILLCSSGGTEYTLVLETNAPRRLWGQDPPRVPNVAVMERETYWSKKSGFTGSTPVGDTKIYVD